MNVPHFINEKLIPCVSFLKVRELKEEENERGRLFSSSCVRTGSHSNKPHQVLHSRVRAMDKSIPKTQWFCNEIESFGERKT